MNTVDKDLMEQQVIQEVSGNMIELMSHDPDPKFQNSQFLQFLNKLKTGELAIKDKELIVNTEFQNQNLENAFQTAEKYVEETKMNPVEEEKLETAWQDAEKNYEESGATKEEIDKIFENAWKDSQAGLYSNEMREEMEMEYKQIIKSMNLENPDEMNKVLADAWQVSQDMEEGELYAEPDQNYQFAQGNPYEILANPLDKAVEHLSAGNRQEAIYALESHVQKNPQDAKAWRLLGKLHQDNDQDRKALPCFLVT